MRRGARTAAESWDLPSIGGGVSSSTSCCRQTAVRGPSVRWARRRWRGRRRWLGLRLCRQRGASLDQLRDLGGVERRGEEVALAEARADRPQLGQLARLLDALGDRLEAQALR